VIAYSLRTWSASRRCRRRVGCAAGWGRGAGGPWPPAGASTRCRMGPAGL